jgi:hypothetical protein
MTDRLVRVAALAVVVVLAVATLWLALDVVLAEPAADTPFVVDESRDLDEDIVVSGQSVEIVGRVRGGVLALGGDVKVAGVVDGDVAAIGGSVVQCQGSHISGDVLVVGGHYKSGGFKDIRNEGTNTLLFAGNTQSLRDFFSNPARELLAPRIDRAFLGWRVAATLFSFVLALGIIAIAPGAISRASERLSSGSMSIAVIGLVGTLAVLLLAGLALKLLSTPVAAFVLGPLLFVFLLVQVFGRVVTYFFVGRWLQRRLLGERSRSQTVALLLGVLTLAFLGSLPVVGALVLFAIFIISTGIILTASPLVRARVPW